MHVDTARSLHARLHTLDLQSARVSGGFWHQRQRINRQSSLRHAFDRLEASGNFNNLLLVLGAGQGTYREPLFMDSDIYKWLEAVGYALGAQPDADLRAKADYAIDLLARAQRPDGYLNSYYQVLKPDRIWQELAHGHELYCAGHLMEAAVAFKRGTGDDSLLTVARKFADLIAREFGPDGRDGPPGHPEVELALVELARATGERRFTALADFFLERRGRGSLSGPKMFTDGYYQDRVPVRDAVELEGHAVRQLYLTSGMTDVYLETGDDRLWQALMRLWADLATRKLHVTGGVGARHYGEAFGQAYELPNDTTYCETCAAIANVMWNWRLLLATGESRYADMLERSLYNSVLSGVSLDGARYFYENPLASPGGLERPDWYGCACCPPNLMRLIALIAHYAVTHDAAGIQVHQFLSGEFQCTGDFGHCVLHTETAYPHAGQITLTFVEAPATPCALSLRIPAWTRGGTRVEVNGVPAATEHEAQGYHVLQRRWQSGDQVRFTLDLTPRLTVANPRVDATRGAFALERGPLVYCLEAADNGAVTSLADLQLDPGAPLRENFQPDLLGGVHTVTAQGWATDAGTWAESLYHTFPPTQARQPATLTAVPYYAWANRGAGGMQVWIPQA